MEDILQRAQSLFANYTRGPMQNNCSSSCCPPDELNSSLLEPIQDIPEQALLDYYHYGPSHIGELSDYKYFLPTFAEKVIVKEWDLWPLSQLILSSKPKDWNNDEVRWLIDFLKSLDKHDKRNLDQLKKTIDFLTELCQNTPPSVG